MANQNQDSELIFRDATLSDLPEIVAIYNSTIASRLVTADTEPVSVESRLPWFEAHSPTKRPLWFVEDDKNTTIGWVSFQSFYGRPAYDATVEISIYLAESQRGKGFGKQVLQHAIDVAPDYGINTILGFIFSHNTRSICLFEDFDFEEWGHLPFVANLDGVERSLMIFGLRISDLE